MRVERVLAARLETRTPPESTGSLRTQGKPLWCPALRMPISGGAANSGSGA